MDFKKSSKDAGQQLCDQASVASFEKTVTGKIILVSGNKIKYSVFTYRYSQPLQAIKSVTNLDRSKQRIRDE